METPAFTTIAERIYHCATGECPLHARIDDPGYYPKFGAGGRERPVLAIITMNPGEPDQIQRRATRRSLTRASMHEEYERGLLRYHAQSRGGGIHLPELVRAHTGLSWDRVYYTEVAKCVSTESEKRDGRRAVALKICASRFLAAELAALPDLRFVICLGGDAYDAVCQVIGASREMRPLLHGGVLKVPHAAAFGQRFRRELPAILDGVGAALARGGPGTLRRGQRDASSWQLIVGPLVWIADNSPSPYRMGCLGTLLYIAAIPTIGAIVGAVYFSWVALVLSVTFVESGVRLVRRRRARRPKV